MKPPYSLWGKIDSVYTINDNVWFVTTESHGGFMIYEPEKFLSEQAITYGSWYGSYLCYEEDLLADIVLYDSDMIRKVMARFFNYSAEDLLADVTRVISMEYPELIRKENHALL